MSTYMERALFVVGPQNAGKSVQLRSMFCDVRFGTDGKVPGSRNLPETYRVTHNRRLYLRLTSPHEYAETTKDWLDKIDRKIQRGRWSIAGALQPEAEKEIPDIVGCVRALIDRFSPERVRCAFLSPDRQGNHAESQYAVDDLSEGLQRLEGVETMQIDARSRETNGLLLADFFDFS